MKRIVASVGLAALGASALSTASAQVAADNTKNWSVAATLRGFYDDNTATLPSSAVLPTGMKRDSFGFEISPSGMWNWSPQEQTSFNLGVLYSLKYYIDKPPFSAENIDQAFTFNAGISHAFTEQLKVRVSDSFVIGQEPDMLRAGNSFATFQRVSGDNIRNYGSIALDWQVTPKFGISVGYDNAYYDYSQNGESFSPAGFSDQFGFPVYNIIPSLSGTLDRDENRAHLEGLYQLLPETKVLLGYQYTGIGYNGDEVIGGYYDPFLGSVFFPVTSSMRNSREHTMYAGAIHNFLPELTGSIRAGGSYIDYYNDPSTQPSWSPYALISLKYAYAKESSVEMGFSYDHSASDVVGFSNGSFTQDAEAAVIFLNVMHRITPALFASLMFQFQNNLYNGGTFDNVTDQYYLLGLDMEYRFSANFSAHAGYNYDNLQSTINGRSFDRNRVYIGVTASY
jgi:hypothetical protein